MHLKEELKKYIDKDYLLIHSRLVKSKYQLDGIRVPIIKKIAKQANIHSVEQLQNFVPDTYEEILLLGAMIAFAKIELKEKLSLLDNFLQYIDNWAICDCTISSLKFATSELRYVWNHFIKLGEADGEYERRFLIVLVLGRFMREDFIDEVLHLYGTIKNGEYYVDMALAWGYAEAMTEFPKETMKIIRQKTLPKFIQNKAIQKMRESFRVPEETKKELLNYKL